MTLLDKQRYIFGSLFLLSNKLQVIGDQYLGKEDMTTKQWFLTAMIAQFHDHPPTLSEVAALMGTSRQNVKQLALKLEEKEFLKIEQDAQDARALRLKLTEKSRAFWDKREKQDNQFIMNLFESLSDEEVNTMANGFGKLAEKVKEMGEALNT